MVKFNELKKSELKTIQIVSSSKFLFNINEFNINRKVLFNMQIDNNGNNYILN